MNEHLHYIFFANNFFNYVNITLSHIFVMIFYKYLFILFYFILFYCNAIFNANLKTELQKK